MKQKYTAQRMFAHEDLPLFSQKGEGMSISNLQPGKEYTYHHANSIVLLRYVESEEGYFGDKHIFDILQEGWHVGSKVKLTTPTVETKIKEHTA
jgi:hypothetical protein